MEAIGKHHQFNQDQLVLLKQMPVGHSIEVTIDYNNTNSATGEISERQIKFSRYLIPSTPATYPDSDQTMNDYFNEAIVNKILSNPFIYTSTAEGSNGLPSIMTQFKIDEEGNVTDLQLTQPSDNEAANILIKETLLNMPRWKAAEENGVAVKQSFTFVLSLIHI